MSVKRAHVEDLLARRATRRGVLAGGLSAAAASIAVSRPRQPTRGFAHVRAAAKQPLSEVSETANRPGEQYQALSVPVYKPAR